MASEDQRKEYILNYYKSQFHKHGINLNHEIKVVGKFLLENVKGKTLDFGCGPAIHFWDFFMKNATTLDGIDITSENIEFLSSYLKEINLEEYVGVEEFIQETLNDPSFNISVQLKKIRKLMVRDFTKDIDGIEYDYDTIVAPFSIGCVKTPEEYEKAIQNMAKHLKENGKALFIGTNGTSSCDIIPEYCHQGVKNRVDVLGAIFKKYFYDVKTLEVELEKDESDMFPYSSIMMVSGLKGK